MSTDLTQYLHDTKITAVPNRFGRSNVFGILVSGSLFSANVKVFGINDCSFYYLTNISTTSSGSTITADIALARSAPYTTGSISIDLVKNRFSGSGYFEVRIVRPGDPRFLPPNDYGLVMVSFSGRFDEDLVITQVSHTPIWPSLNLKRYGPNWVISDLPRPDDRIFRSYLQGILQLNLVGLSIRSLIEAHEYFSVFYIPPGTPPPPMNNPPPITNFVLTSNEDLRTYLKKLNDVEAGES